MPQTASCRYTYMQPQPRILRILSRVTRQIHAKKADPIQALYLPRRSAKVHIHITFRYKVILHVVYSTLSVSRMTLKIYMIKLRLSRDNFDRDHDSFST